MKIKAKKGCVNPECTLCKKKVHAHKEDVFCPRCGASLSFVCLKCHTVLPDGSKKICIGCEVKKDDAQVKRNDMLKKVGAGALSVASVGASAVALIVKKK